MFGDFWVLNQGPWGDPALLNWWAGLSRAQRRLYDLLNRLVRHSTPPLDTPPRATSPRPPPPLSHQAKMKDFQQLILACVFLSWEASGRQFSAHTAPFDLGSKWQLTSVWGHVRGFWGIEPGTLGRSCPAELVGRSLESPTPPLRPPEPASKAFYSTPRYPSPRIRRIRRRIVTPPTITTVGDSPTRPK